MTPREELLAAAQLIRTRGWFQLQPKDLSVCMFSALRKGYSDKTYNALREVTGVGVMRFNDFHCETADDAIAALEIAADLAT